jgi:hypothetical protein
MTKQFGDVSSANKLSIPRNINGIAFDGTADITVADSTKVPTTRTVNGHALSSNVTVTATDVSLGNVDNTSDATKNSAAVTLTNKTLTTPVLTGLPTGTGVDSAATASTLAARDSNANLSADAFIPSSTSTAASASTITLTVDSTEIQIITGSTSQTMTLPTTGIVAGQRYTIINNSSAGNTTVNASGGGTISSFGPGIITTFIAEVATPTTTAQWNSFSGLAAGVFYTQNVIASGIAQRDGSSNLKTNAFIPSFTTTATAAGTTTLTVTSTEVQEFTGSSSQTLVLPTTSIVAGQRYTIFNNSSGGNITINASGGGNIMLLAGGLSVTLTAVVATPTTAANWQASPISSAGATASTFARRDGNANLLANAFIPSFTTTATAAGTTTLTVSSSQTQIFTGSLAQTVLLPTTGVAAGQAYTIISSSSGAVTVQSSGGNTVATINSNVTTITFTALQATPTTAAHWMASRFGSISASKLFGTDASGLPVTLAYSTSFVNNSIAQRTSNGQIIATTYISSTATTATAAGTTTLVVGSVQVQIFTGSSTQTVLLPTTGIIAGQQFNIVNQSTGAVTVQSSGANTIQVLPGGTSGTFVSLVNTPTTAANWQGQFLSNLVSSTTTASSTVMTRGITGNAFANQFIPNLTSTVTAAGTTTLTTGSQEVQVFTGSTTQTLVLPTTSIIAGQRYSVLNPSSGVITINASDATLVKSLAAGASTVVTPLQATPTTNTHWFAT